MADRQDDLAKAHQAIGAYVCAYSEAAHELGETLKVLFQIKENEMADAIVAALGDFSRQASLVWTICASARNANGSELSEGQKKAIERTIKNIFSCNDDRVKLAHGRLQPMPDGSVKLVHTKVVKGKLRKDSETWSQADIEKKVGDLKELAAELLSFQRDLQTIKIQIPEGTIDFANTFSSQIYSRPMSAALIDMLSQSRWVPRPPEEPKA